ncbi:MAG: segregation/condensation protein A [Myxococcota bacterium]
MKRKLGRFFARFSGVLRRVWRWLLPTPGRTEVQLAPPRPDAPSPAVTREVIDLEFEEIRAALAAEPSVTAAAPDAPRRPAPAAPPPEPAPVEAPAYKAPKYGREPKAKLAAPRPTPIAPRVEAKAEEPKAPVAPTTPLEDTAVADLIARVDMFMHMGDLPLAPPESVIAVEPELLVEEPTVRQQIVEQLLAEQMAAAEPEVADEPVAPAPEVLAAAGYELAPAVDVPAEHEAAPVALPETEAPEGVVASIVEPSVEAVMAADEELVAADEAPVVTEETSATDASDEGKMVADAAWAMAESVHMTAVEAVAGEAVTAAADVVVEPVALASVLEEPVAEEPVIAEPVIDGDAEIESELEAAMAQAEDANTAFATNHPGAVEEMAEAKPVVDEDERIEDEPWSPPPVMADPYYEYAMAAEGEERLADEAIAEQPIAESRAADEAMAEGAPVPPEVAAMAVEEPLPPEVAAMATDEPSPEPVLEPASLSDEATIDAVTTAVEETMAAADTLAAATDALGEMPADADALAAAAMADVVATATAAEEEPQAPTPSFRNPIPKVETPTDYVATPESMHAIYQLQLDGFEGPLDLLLHLIRRHHLDVFDIPIAFICERYLEYLKAMEDVDIDVASEFLFMAAELLQLKSRMLLPRPEGETADEEEIDPRAELVRRLLEYQKYKDVAERFGLLDRFGRDTFGRDAEPTPPPEGEAPLKEVGLFALVKAFQSCLDRQKPEVRHQVMLEQVSVRQRIRTLVQRFESQEPMRFEALLEDARRRIDIVVTFLALLEMGKLKLLRIFQNEDGVIYVHPKFDDVSLAFARLEGLDESQYAG